MKFKILIILALVMNVGCASFGKKLKALLGGGGSQQQSGVPKNTGPKFSTQSTYLNGPDRQYKRMNRQRFEDQASLDSQSGSLWVMEGQGSYLFAQNIMRMIGDPISINVEGEAKGQLTSKSNVIKKLQAKLEARRAAYERGPASATAKGEEKPEGEKPKEGEEKATGGEAQKTAEAEKSGKEELPGEFDVKSIPTRVVERLVDGNYRVKGSQTFMIGPREYKVIVTGIVRAEDFSDEGISSSKLIESKFDVVTSRKTGVDL